MEYRCSRNSSSFMPENPKSFQLSPRNRRFPPIESHMESEISICLMSSKNESDSSARYSDQSSSNRRFWKAGLSCANVFDIKKTHEHYAYEYIKTFVHQIPFRWGVFRFRRMADRRVAYTVRAIHMARGTRARKAKW